MLFVVQKYEYFARLQNAGAGNGRLLLPEWPVPVLVHWPLLRTFALRNTTFRIPIVMEKKTIRLIYPQWQGGDIVIFENHIGIVSDMRNKRGVPYVIHHSGPFQAAYEEDILESRGDIVGHYRVSQ